MLELWNSVLYTIYVTEMYALNSQRMIFAY